MTDNKFTSKEFQADDAKITKGHNGYLTRALLPIIAVPFSAGLNWPGLEAVRVHDGCAARLLLTRGDEPDKKGTNSFTPKTGHQAAVGSGSENKYIAPK